MLVLPAICRQLANNQYLKNRAYLSLRMYCKPRFQSWFVKMFAKANLAVFRLSTDEFIFGCWQFPSRWGSCLQRGQRGTGLCNCSMVFSAWSLCTSDPFSRLANLNLPLCVTCPEAKAGLNIGVFGEIFLPTFHAFGYSSIWGSMTLNFVFPRWCFLMCSCHWNPVVILALGSLPFPLCLIGKMEESFPVFLELIRKACFLIAWGDLPASGVYSCFPSFFVFLSFLNFLWPLL